MELCYRFYGDPGTNPAE